MIIEGLFRTKSKIHITSAVDGDVKINDKGQIGTEDARIPFSRTYRTAVFTPEGRVEVPFFPANSLVGRLRRAATEMIVSSLRDREEQITRTAYRGLSCGAADPSPETAGLLVEEFGRYLKDPFIGLFGGGKRLYESGYKLFDIVPVTKSTVDSGMVPPDFMESMAMLSSGDNARFASRVTGIDIVHRRDDLLDGVQEEISSTISDYDGLFSDMAQEAQRKIEGAAERAAKRSGDKIEKTDEKKTARVSMSQQTAREYISPGVPMYFKTALKERVTEEQLGLFGLSLQAVFNENAFGGVSHLGYGEMNLHDVAQNVVLHGKDSSDPLFEVVTKSGQTRLEFAHPEMIAAVEKTKTWLTTVSPSDLESFYLASAPPKPKKEKAGAEEASAEAQG